MKKVLFIAVALVAFILVSCNKKDDLIQPDKSVQKVAVIKGDYILKNSDIFKLKSANLGQVTINWSMLSNNPTFYSELTLIDGREFKTGSAAYNFWNNTANNPISFSTGQSVYSNLTPDEDVRLIAETKNANDTVSYLGMIDFNPTSASFPLVVNGFRLGDELKINTNAVTSLPGGNNLTITVTFSVAPIDLTATKAAAYGSLHGPSATPNGKDFAWTDIVYGPAVSQTVTIPNGSGNYEVYSSLTGKVIGDVTVTLTETGNGGSVISKSSPAMGAGQGLSLTLTTTKIGWYDSGTIVWHNTDINIVPASLLFD